jgi:hypothetical protein
MKGMSTIYQTLIQFSGYNERVAGMFLFMFYAGLVLSILIDINKSLLIAYLMSSSLLISYVLSSKMPMMPRYMIYLLPIYFLGIASSYKEIYSIVKDRRAIYILMVLIIMTSLPYFSDYYSGFQKGDWRGFSMKLQQITHTDDVIVVLPGYITEPLDYYYDNKSDRTYEYEATNSLQLQQIYSRNKGHQIFYVVTSDINAANPKGDAIQWLKNNTQLLEKYTDICLYRIQPHYIVKVKTIY